VQQAIRVAQRPGIRGAGNRTRVIAIHWLNDIDRLHCINARSPKGAFHFMPSHAV